MTLVFASANKHKIEEINALMPNSFHVIGLEQIGLNYEIPETAETIKGNSLLKANHVLDFLKQKKLNYTVFADDSGLEVEALNGAPGVYSARFAGEPKSDANNNIKLLNELRQFTNRKAAFVTVISLINASGIHVFEGKITGTIAFEPRGNNGFGYDPVFIPQGYRSTFAELPSETKHAISHRAKAIKALLNFLEERH